MTKNMFYFYVFKAYKFFSENNQSPIWCAINAFTFADLQFLSLGTALLQTEIIISDGFEEINVNDGLHINQSYEFRGLAISVTAYAYAYPSHTNLFFSLKPG